jgi:hypothetical protein
MTPRGGVHEQRFNLEGYLIGPEDQQSDGGERNNNNKRTIAANLVSCCIKPK